MATTNLKVDELRTQLAQRGLSTFGTKATLVRRLEAAIQEEDKELSDSNGDLSNNRKRQRDSDTKDADSDVPRKIKVIDELRSMSVKQLREEVAVRGVSAAGTKKELIERLYADDNSMDNDQVKEEKKEGKMVTAIKKGSAVLDQWLPDNIKMQFHVLQVGDEIYDAMLNQTNVGENNNKFYIIQVLGLEISNDLLEGGNDLVISSTGQSKGPYVL